MTDETRAIRKVMEWIGKLSPAGRRYCLEMLRETESPEPQATGATGFPPGARSE